ncbi:MULTISPECIES: hypothetical protein [unclassified Streptomyces]|uniref:hypothetical protein n=1 Tax=unclassified Streptomyces TaxID=2593676 RepID=UPI0037F6F5DC
MSPTPTNPTTLLREAIDQAAELHELYQGACGTCADETGQAAAWPCETATALEQARRVLGNPTTTTETRNCGSTQPHQPHQFMRMDVAFQCPGEPADRRNRIADALADADGWEWAPGFDKTRSPSYQGYLRQADAVLAALAAEAQQPTPAETEEPAPSRVGRCPVMFEGGGRCEKDADHRAGRWPDDPHTPEGHGRPVTEEPTP